MSTIQEKIEGAENNLNQAVAEEASKERLQDIPLAKIVRDKKLQPRVHIKTERIEEYAELTEHEPNKLPPISAFYEATQDRYWVWDGWTRIAAREHLGQPLYVTSIPAMVRPGTREDAIEAASAANAGVGEPRTNDDELRAIRNLLTEVPKWRAKGDREIARACALGEHSGHKKVARVYAKLVEEKVIPPREEERQVSRGGQEYTQKPKAKLSGSMTQIEKTPSADDPQPPLFPPQDRGYDQKTLLPAPARPWLHQVLKIFEQQYLEEGYWVTVEIPKNAHPRSMSLALMSVPDQVVNSGYTIDTKHTPGAVRLQLHSVREWGDLLCTAWARSPEHPTSPETKLTQEDLEGFERALSEEASGELSTPAIETSSPTSAPSIEESVNRAATQLQESAAPPDGGAARKAGKLVKVKCPRCQGNGLMGRAPDTWSCLWCLGAGHLEVELIPNESNGNGGYQHYNTPPVIIEPARLLDRIAFDPCHNAGSLWKADETCNEQEDGLATKWSWVTIARGGLIVVNPPWQNVGPWVDRIIQEVSWGAQVLLIGPAGNPSSEWYQKALRSAGLRCDPTKRICYFKEGKEDTSPRDSTVLFYWGEKLKRFAAIFGRGGLDWYVSQQMAPFDYSEASELLRQQKFDARQAELPLEAAPPQLEAPKVELPAEPNDWLERGIKSFEGLRTQEEASSIFVKLDRKATTDEEKIRLVDAYEAVKAKLPHGDNVRLPKPAHTPAPTAKAPDHSRPFACSWCKQKFSTAEKKTRHELDKCPQRCTNKDGATRCKLTALVSGGKCVVHQKSTKGKKGQVGR